MILYSGYDQKKSGVKPSACRGVRRMMDNSSEKWLYAKRASARTSTSAHHFHNESQTIKPSSLDELLSRVATVYHFFAGHFGLPHRLSAVGSHHTLYYWSFGCRPSWWGLLTLFFWVFLGYRIRDEEMRW